MRLSEDRISHISHQIHDRLYLDEMVDYTDEDKALAIIKNVISKFVHAEDEIDDFVREKIKSLKKGVMEGTPEWDILHRKYTEEERRKRGISE